MYGTAAAVCAGHRTWQRVAPAALPLWVSPSDPALHDGILPAVTVSLGVELGYKVQGYFYSVAPVNPNPSF